MAQKEVWKPIPGYVGIYEVSNHGRVRNSSTREIKGASRNQFGHLKVHLWKNNSGRMHYIHRLVFESFNGAIPEGHDVHHIDNDPENNHDSNLKAIDHRKHVSSHMKGKRHALGMKRSREAIDSQRAKVSKPVGQYSLSGELIAIYPSLTEAQRQTGIDNSGISRCCKGKMRQTGGYQWAHMEK